MNLSRVRDALLRGGAVQSGDARTLKHGSQSGIYFEVEQALGSGYAAPILEAMREIIPCSNLVSDSGGGLMLAAQLSGRYGYNLTRVRDSPKGHGADRMLEGYLLRPYDEVAIVDDVCTTGGSFGTLIRTLDGKAAVRGCYAVINRGSVREVRGIPVHSILRLEDFL